MSQRAGGATGSTTAGTPRTRPPVVSAPPPPLLAWLGKRKVVPCGLLSAGCLLIPTAETPSYI